MKKEAAKKILAYISSFVFIFLVWGLYATYINAELILPSPAAVIKKMILLSGTQKLYINLAATTGRVFVSFFIAVLFGTGTGILSSLSVFAKSFLQFPISVIRTTPVVALILLALFWFNSSSVPVFVSVLMAFPVVHSAVEKGLSENASSETEKLLSMAKLYNFNKKQIYKYILLPGCRPAFLSGLESCFGLCWKVTVAGEVLSLPRNACGSLLQKSQVHLETDSVMAITIILVLLSFLFQNLLRLICKNWEIKN